MASDEAYASFLEQRADEDTGAGGAATNKSKNSKKVGAKAVDTEVPAPLRQVDAYYVSDADEPFEPVSLRWEGEKGELDEGTSYCVPVACSCALAFWGETAGRGVGC